MMTSVLIADDHGFVRAAFTRLVNASKEFEVVAEAETGEQAVIRYRETKPQVAVMDLAMPGIGGAEAIRRIINHDKHARLLALTAYTEAPQLKRVLAAGALGLLSKNCRPSVFFAAIRAVASGKPYLEQSIAQALALHTLEIDQTPMDLLTDREFEIARLLASGKAAKEVAELLNLSPKTVSTYLSHVYGKLGVNNLAGLTRLAIKLRVIEG